MTGDRTTTDPKADKAQPAGASRASPSTEELSRQLAERLARQRAADPGAAAAARRAALLAYDQARERRLIVALSVVLAATVAASVGYFVSTIDSQPVPPLASAATRPQPAPPVETAAALPAPALDSAPAPAASAADTPAAEPATAQAADSQAAPVNGTPNPAPLQRDDVREIQAKLRSFGFNPGPVDGNPGRMTEGAVRRYQQDRGQPQTGEIDNALLQQLRQDPAPPAVQQVAQRAARPARSPGPRRSDPFEPVRAAGNRFGQWMDSLVR
ncbi:MAG TPA: peptidoglycan-binding domain-containing protein [Reyranella sp.]|nr:peptidoglycan-binding domain-containing protein [Reyranella sp.]